MGEPTPRRDWSSLPAPTHGTALLKFSIPVGEPTPRRDSRHCPHQHMAQHCSNALMLTCYISHASNASIPTDASEAFESTLHTACHQPVSYAAAMRSPQAAQWIAAMEEEKAAFFNNGSCEIVDLDPSWNLLSSKWVFKVKRDGSGLSHNSIFYIVSTTINIIPSVHFCLNYYYNRKLQEILEQRKKWRTGNRE